MAIFSHYFHSGIRLEIKINKKITETKHPQTPIKSANIYLIIKTTGSLHILWSSDQKILHQTLGQHSHVNITCELNHSRNTVHEQKTI